MDCGVKTNEKKKAKVVHRCIINDKRIEQSLYTL